MLISNVHIIGVPGSQDIRVKDGKIRSVLAHDAGTEEDTIKFSGDLAFPGLINSHDHLDFNLFPQLRNRIYNNYTEWGNDIHTNNTTAINEILKIPKELRVQWGICKNLLNGITTVVNHGEKIKQEDDLVNVLQDSHTLHSVRFEKNWKWKLNDPFKKDQPFVIHTGEGKDENAIKEINELIKWNLLKKKMIGVHAVAMDQTQAGAFKALVWCPASNFFLLDKTASVEKLKKATAIIFGTDSTLTAGWNIWEHLRLARKQEALSDEELFDSVTKTAAKVWQLNDRGNIGEDKVADIVIAKARDASMDSFYALNPADILLVLKDGDIKLFDASIKEQLSIRGFSKVTIGTAVKYIKADITGLIEKIKKFYPGAIFPISV